MVRDFENTKIGIKCNSCSNFTENVTRKWSLSDEDKDMIIMWHKINYTFENNQKELISHMEYIGKDSEVLL